MKTYKWETSHVYFFYWNIWRFDENLYSSIQLLIPRFRKGLLRYVSF